MEGYVNGWVKHKIVCLKKEQLLIQTIQMKMVNKVSQELALGSNSKPKNQTNYREVYST